MVSRKRRDSVSEIVEQDLETGRQVEIYSSKLSVRSTALSKDGRSLAFVEFHQGDPIRGQLMVLPLAGGQPRWLLQSQSANTNAGLAWSSDGRYIYFHYLHEGSYPRFSLRRVATENGAVEDTGLTVEGLRFSSIHPDGTKVAFTGSEGGFDEAWALENFLPELRAAR